MFTGIVEEVGTVATISDLPDAARLTVSGPLVASDAKHGDSIAVNGVCLTVVGLEEGAFAVDVIGETLRRSSLAKAKPGETVNLERAVAVGGRLGGHIVQGHVDGTAAVLSREPSSQPGNSQPGDPQPGDPQRGDPQPDYSQPDNPQPDNPQPDNAQWDLVRFSVPRRLARYLVEKGSVAVDGVSLTVVEAGPDWFTVGLIPATLELTTLAGKRPGDIANIEVDVIAKYVERLHSALDNVDEAGMDGAGMDEAGMHGSGMHGSGMDAAGEAQ